MPVDAYTLLHGDCLELLRTLPDNSVDAVVTDPPYGLSFMGKRWDYDVPSEDIWRECLRVLKPGGHLLAFAGTRTQHRMAVRIEDAGFEIRDMIAWVYGSGFPKSHNLDGAWHGWGTALKPALEPITVARKPLVGTVAENVLEHGTGALNVDGCRVDAADSEWTATKSPTGTFSQEHRPWKDKLTGVEVVSGGKGGRWPANLIHNGSEEVVELFPVTGPAKAGGKSGADPGMWSGKKQSERGGHNDNGGSAARFFYCAKASKADRDEGCEGMEAKGKGARDGERVSNTLKGPTNALRPDSATISRNHHPTVKPTDLMRYLCRLVTPPGGVVLDPFMGSGSTGKAAILEGFRFIGCEREAEYLDIARARIEAAVNERAQELPLAAS